MPLVTLPPVEAAKRLAAYAAVDRHIGLEHLVSLSLIVEVVLVGGRVEGRMCWREDVLEGG